MLVQNMPSRARECLTVYPNALVMSGAYISAVMSERPFFRRAVLRTADMAEQIFISFSCQSAIFRLAVPAENPFLMAGPLIHLSVLENPITSIFCSSMSHRTVQCAQSGFLSILLPSLPFAINVVPPGHRRYWESMHGFIIRRRCSHGRRLFGSLICLHTTRNESLQSLAKIPIHIALIVHL